MRLGGDGSQCVGMEPAVGRVRRQPGRVQRSVVTGCGSTLAEEGQVGRQGEGGRSPHPQLVVWRRRRCQARLHVPGRNGEDGGRQAAAGGAMVSRRCRCRRRGGSVMEMAEGGGVDVDGRQAVVGGRGGGEESIGVTHGREQGVGHRTAHCHVGRTLRVLGTLSLLPKEPVLLLVKVRLGVLLHFMRRRVRHVRTGQRGRRKVHRFARRQRP